MNKHSKIFVAGHNGLVGSALMRALKEQGYTNIITRTHTELDLVNQEQTDEFFAQNSPEYVFLSAALAGGIMANMSRKADFIYENSQIACNVIHSAYKYGVKKLLYLASTSIYPKNSALPTDENALWQGELEYTNKAYAIAKLLGVSLCENYNIQYKTNFLSIVPINLYGNDDKFDFKSAHVLPAMLRKFHLAKLLENSDIAGICDDLGILDQNLAITELKKQGIEKGKISIWGSGNAKREFLHADDLAPACLYVMNNLEFHQLITNSDEIKNTQLNVSSGSNISIKDLAYMIKEIVGFKGEIYFDTTKPEGIKERLTSSKKLQSLGWKPKITLEKGVKDMYDWYVNTKNVQNSVGGGDELTLLNNSAFCAKVA